MREPIEVTKQCPFTGTVKCRVITLDLRDYEHWINGDGLIQDCLPYLSADDREFLLTGITPEMWELQFGGDE